MTMMSTAYREILYRQLAWLPSLLPSPTERFTFQVIDLNTLALAPSGEWVHSLFKEREYVFRKHGSVLLISAEGKVLGEVGREEVAVLVKKWSWRHFGYGYVTKMRPHLFYETVEQSLGRMTYSDKTKTRYILELSSTRQGGDAVLHKLPKSADDIVAWLGHKSKEAREQFSSFLQTA